MYLIGVYIERLWTLYFFNRNDTFPGTEKSRKINIFAVRSSNIPIVIDVEEEEKTKPKLSTERVVVYTCLCIIILRRKQSVREESRILASKASQIPIK